MKGKVRKAEKEIGELGPVWDAIISEVDARISSNVKTVEPRKTQISDNPNRTLV